jgi:F0F1-type ATP synthase assembly protein I
VSKVKAARDLGKQRLAELKAKIRNKTKKKEKEEDKIEEDKEEEDDIHVNDEFIASGSRDK